MRSDCLGLVTVKLFKVLTEHLQLAGVTYVFGAEDEIKQFRSKLFLGCIFDICRSIVLVVGEVESQDQDKWELPPSGRGSRQEKVSC